MVLLQSEEQPCGASGVSLHMTSSNVCHPVYPAAHPASAGRLCSGAAASHLSGRSPSLVAMERVVPKYASWASLDADVARWHHVMARRNIAGQQSLPDALVQSGCGAVGSPGRNLSALPVTQLPPAAAAAAGAPAGSGTLGLMPVDTMTSSTGSLSPTVTMSDSVSVRSAKDELRAHLTHRPVSNSASCHLSQIGKSAVVVHTFTVLSCHFVVL